MRFRFSLSEGEMKNLYFQMGKFEPFGTVSVKLTEKRFVEILSKALEWKEQQKMVEEAKKNE